MASASLPSISSTRAQAHLDGDGLGPAHLGALEGQARRGRVVAQQVAAAEQLVDLVVVAGELLRALGQVGLSSATAPSPSWATRA